MVIVCIPDQSGKKKKKDILSTGRAEVSFQQSRIVLLHPTCMLVLNFISFATFVIFNIYGSCLPLLK